MNQTMDLANFTERFIAEAKTLLHPKQRDDFDEALRQAAESHYKEPCDPAADPEKCAQDTVFEWQSS